MEKGSLGEAVIPDLWDLGFTEFPERFRSVWARLDERLALMREQEAFHAAEVRRLDAALAARKRAIEDLVLQVRESLRPELDLLLRGGAASHRELPGGEETARRLLALEKLYAAACALPLPGRLALLPFPRRRREREAAAKSFFDGCLDLASVLLAAPPPSAGTSLADAKSTACARLYDACRRVYQDLLDLQVTAELPRRPEREQILVLESEMDRIEEERRRIEILFAETAAARSRLRERHAAAREAVLDVGREIADGRRTPGQGTPFALCATCSGLMPAEAPSCFLCGVPQGGPVELRVPCPDSPVSA
jgi:hypothetical protein